MKTLVIIICCYSFVYFSNRKHIKLFLFLALVGLCSIYFSWIPPTEADLNSHYRFMEDIRDMSFFDVISMNPNNIEQITSIYTVKFITTCPFFSTFVWLFTFVKEKELLPFCVSLLVYGISIRFLFFASKQSNGSVKNIKIGFFYILCLTNFIGISGLRNPMSFAIFAMTIYYDLVEKRNFSICLAIYILTCLIHSACVVLLAFRLFYIVARRWNILVVYFLIILSVIFVNIVLNVLSGAGGILGFIVNTYSGYLINGSGVVNGYNRAIKLLNYMWFIYLFYIYHKIAPKKNSELLKFCGLILVFTICNYQNYDVFVRMIYFLLPLSSYFVIGVFSSNKNVKTFKEIFYFVSIFTLIWLTFTGYYVLD